MKWRLGLATLKETDEHGRGNGNQARPGEASAHGSHKRDWRETVRSGKVWEEAGGKRDDGEIIQWKGREGRCRLLEMR